MFRYLMNNSLEVEVERGKVREGGLVEDIGKKQKGRWRGRRLKGVRGIGVGSFAPSVGKVQK